MKLHNEHRRSGFTLLETLLAVGILIILLAVGAVAVATYRTSLKMNELDATAREIYVAAQNRLIALKTSDGSVSLPKDNSIVDKPKGFPDKLTWDKSSYYYIKGGANADTNDTNYLTFLPTGSIDETVRTGGYYIIEYNANTATVYSVFYAEKAFSYDTVKGLANRERATRKAADPMLGYYGGSDIVSLKRADTPDPVVELINDETLYLSITPAAKTLYTFTIKDESGNSSTVTLLTDANCYVTSFAANGITPPSGMCTPSPTGGKLAITLDSLLDKLHFKDLFPSLTPGENLTISVVSQRQDVLSNPSNPRTLTSSSLFDNASTAGNASISKGRHLQNLEPTISGISNTTITAAVQTADIDWRAAYSDKTVTTYEGTSLEKGMFRSIVNSGLKSYDGGGKAITGLTTAESAIADDYTYTYSGLFGKVASNAVLKDITLINEIVGTADYAGGLLAYGSGVKIDGCKIYVNDAEKAKAANYTVTGSYVGGLVGYLSGGSITESLYAGGKVTGAATCHAAGGLVGASESASTISGSYSNTAVSGGTTAGGLIGSADGATISNCYSCGSIAASGSGRFGGFAGLLKGGSVSSTYCAMDYTPAGTVTIAAYCNQAKNATYTFPTFNNCYYLHRDGDGSTAPSTAISGISSISYMEIKDLIGNDGTFSKDNWSQATLSNTHAYTMAGYYPFLRVGNLEHYGDWPFPDLGPIQMAYYEIYLNTDGSYSLGLYNDEQFYTNTLRDDLPVVQDGYMLLLQEDTNSGTQSACGKKLSDIYTSKSNALVVKGNKNLDGTSASAKNISINGTAVSKLTLEGTTTDLVGTGSNYVSFALGKYTYYPFFLSADDVVTNIQSGAVANFTVKASSNTWTSFWFTPTFAKSRIEVQDDISAGGATFTIGSSDTLYIRTERQLATLATYSTAAASKDAAANIKSWWTKGWNFIQERGLVFGDKNPYTTTYLGTTLDAKYRDTIDPIGQTGYVFTGTYDAGTSANGTTTAHSITGAQIASTSLTDVGLFGTAKNLTVKNLRLASCTISGSGTSTGLLAGNLGGTSTLENIDQTNCAVGSTGTGANVYTGGFAGQLSGSLTWKDTSCTMPTVTASAGSAGGVFGQIGSSATLDTGRKLTVNASAASTETIPTTPSTVTGSGWVGGFVGTTSVGLSNIDLTVQSVANSSSSSGAGGFAGWIARGTSDSDISINATGEITSAGAAGGFVGTIQGTGGSLTNIAVTLGGSVSGDSGCGGITGTLNIPTKNCTVTGSGNPTLTTASGFVGGFAGQITAAVNITDCSVTGVTVQNSTANPVGGFAGQITLRAVLDGCSVSNSIVTNTGSSLTGGFVASSSSAPSFTGCTVSGTTVTADDSQNVGGFIGEISTSMTFSSCSVSNSTVTGSAGGSACAGGFVGYSGKSLSGLTVEDTAVTGNGQYVGGFAGDISNSTVSDLTVTGGSVTSSCTSSNSYAGGLVGYAQSPSTFKTCSVSAGSVTSSNTSDTSYTGGLVGNGGTSAVTFTSCSVSGGSVTSSNTSGSSYVGGFIGIVPSNITVSSGCSVSDVSVTNKSTSEGAYTGGFTGYVAKALTEISVDNGTVSAGGGYCGGFAGRIEKVSLTNCDVRLSKANKSGSTNGYAVSGGKYTGGFVGYFTGNNASSGNTELSNCFAAIPVSGGGDYTGGLIGSSVGATVKACYASGTVTGGGNYTGGLIGSSSYSGDNLLSSVSVMSCYATGDVNGNGGSYAGGLTGYVSGGVYYSCYATGKVSGAGSNGGAIGGRSYVEDYSKDQDVMASFAVLLHQGVKVTNRTDCGVKYLKDGSGNYVYNALGLYILDTQNCKTILDYISSSIRLDSGAEIISESNLTRKPDGSVKTAGSRVQNVFNKLMYFGSLKAGLGGKTWCIYDGSIYWIDQDVNDSISTAGNTTTASSNSIKDSNPGCKIDTNSGSITNGTFPKVKQYSNNDYSPHKYIYNLFDFDTVNKKTVIKFNSPSLSQTKIGSTVIVGVSYLTGEGYNVGMVDSNVDGIDPWSSTQFRDEVGGKTEHFTGFLPADNDFSYSQQSGYPYPAIRNVGSTAGATSAEHWGSWPVIDSGSGYIAYYETYQDGSVGYYAAGYNGTTIFDSLDKTKEITKTGYCYLRTSNSGTVLLGTNTDVGWNYNTKLASSSNSVTLTLTKKDEDSSTSYSQTFYVYTGLPSSPGGYTTVRIDGSVFQYDTDFAKAAIVGRWISTPRWYIRTAAQLANVSSYSGTDTVFVLDRDVTAADSLGTLNGTFDGGTYTITASKPVFDTIAGTGIVQNLNVSGAPLAISNAGTITGCAVSGTVSGADTAAGFVTTNSGAISQSFFSGTVSGKSAAGFVYTNTNTGTITNCFAVGSVTATGENPANAAYGFAAAGGSKISDSYCATQVTATASTTDLSGAATANTYTFSGDGASTSCYYLLHDAAGNHVYGIGKNAEDLAKLFPASGKIWTGTYSAVLTVKTPAAAEGSSSEESQIVSTDTTITLPCFELPVYVPNNITFTRTDTTGSTSGGKTAVLPSPSPSAEPSPSASAEVSPETSPAPSVSPSAAPAPSPSASAAVTPTPSASPSATPSATPSASPSGTKDAPAA